MDRWTMIVLLCCALSGCFSDPGLVDVEDTSSSGSSEVTTISMSTSTVTSASASATSTISTTGDMSSTGISGSTEDSGSTSIRGSTGVDLCTPLELAVLEPLGIGEQWSMDLDFDDTPVDPGEIATLCMAFSTANNASARTVTIGTEVVSFGPCGAAPETLYVLCAEYVEPDGVVTVTIDNMSPDGGCQSGAMDEIGLTFGCSDGGSTG